MSWLLRHGWGRAASAWEPCDRLIRAAGVIASGVLVESEHPGPGCPSWLLCRVPVALTQRWLRPESPRAGLLHEGGGALTWGCEYCTSPRISWSTPTPAR